MPLLDSECGNISFVQAVEEFPVLYNYNLKEYSNRNEQERAWRALAERFQATETECKSKWKNIRGGFTRYLKSLNTTGSGAKKPYYLWEVLQFLMPHTKSRSQSGNLPATVTQPTQQPSQDSEDDDTAGNTPVEDQLPLSPATAADRRTPDTAASSTVSQPPSLTPSASLSAWRSIKAKERKLDPLERSVTMYFNKKGSEAQSNAPVNNPDLDFFKSILPDMANFTPAQKRQFKRKVIDIIDELSGDNTTPPSYRPSSSTTTNTFTSDNSNTREETCRSKQSTESTKLNFTDLLTDDANYEDGEHVQLFNL